MTVYLARRETVAILTLDRQHVLNALSFAMLREIGDAIDQVAQSDARALIVTGAGPKAFCAGADIKELRGRSLLDQKRGSELGQGVFAKLDTLPVPRSRSSTATPSAVGLNLPWHARFGWPRARRRSACPRSNSA